MGATGTPGARPRPSSGSSWPLVLPLTLLVILGLAGLRGTVTAPHLTGPLRHYGPVIGLGLEAILGVLLVLTYRRRSRAIQATTPGEVQVNDVPAKLREALLTVFGAGMIAVAVAIFISFHLHLPAPPPWPRSSVSARPRPTGLLRPRNGAPSGSFHVSLTVVLYILLIVVLVAAVLLSIWWSRRFRPSFSGRTRGFLAQDPEDLREAVESGRSALRNFDDARAAIIACYVAMETSLAERGTARAAADTLTRLIDRLEKL